jgi:glycerol uptake facilitator-like aquaporin
LGLGGGDCLKFSNVVVATASVVLIGFLLDSVVRIPLLPVSSASMSELLAWIIAFLVTSLIVGYVFALKIQEESRIKAIGKIVVLSSLAVMLLVMVWFANPLANPAIKDTMTSMFSTSGWTNADWSAYSAFLATVDVVVAAVLIFIGLYVGSMLRKPEKT